MGLELGPPCGPRARPVFCIAFPNCPQKFARNVAPKTEPKFRAEILARKMGQDLGPKNGPRSWPEKRSKALVRRTAQCLSSLTDPHPGAPIKNKASGCRRITLAPRAGRQQCEANAHVRVLSTLSRPTTTSTPARCAWRPALYTKRSTRARPNHARGQQRRRWLTRWYKGAMHCTSRTLSCISAPPPTPCITTRGAYTTAHRAVAAIEQRCSEATLLKHSRARGVPVE